MNENEFQKKENSNKNFFSLKEENEDNLIQNNSKKNKKIETFENKEINYEPKYRIDYKKLINHIERNTGKKLNDLNELFANLLLIPSDINIQNKSKALSFLVKFYQKENKKEQLIRIAIKFEKMIKSHKDIEPEIYLNCFYKTASILYENHQNFFYALKYANKCVMLAKIMKNKNLDVDLINNCYNIVTQLTLGYLADKKKLFSDINIVEKAEKMNELINLIIKEKNTNLETDENDEDKKYLYVINKEWIYNLIAFLIPFVKEGKSKSSKSIEKCFDFNYVYESYLKNDESQSKKTQIECNIFPGPIDNFKITSFKDSWKDNENLDENDYIKKNSQYILVNYEDWNLLNSHFGCTNIIRRKKNNLDMISFKFVLLDKRINNTTQNLKLLKEKYIQVSKCINIKQLKEKILRCADNELNSKENGRQICFYILDRDKSQILIEIIFAFVNSLQMYESLYIKKIEVKDEENLDNLFAVFDQKKHFLIIEIIKKDDMNFLIKIDNANKCTVCGKTLEDEKEVYKCKFCHFSLFCSKGCSTNSDIHELFDKSIKQILDEGFNLENFLSSKYNYLLNNYGQGRKFITIEGEDQSFFPSTIHCLSYTLALTRYFLSEIYRQEQKPDIEFYISNTYFQLINKLWEFGSSKFSIKIQKFCQVINLKNYQNVDPIDFISNFFEKLTEELNRAKGNNEKEEEEEEQKAGESDEEACKRFSNNFKKKKDSIITDLFYGQIKQTIKCANCGNNYVKYPFFYFLKLPIPDKKINIQIKLFTNSLIGYYVNVKINENTEMKDILFKSMEYLKKDNYIKNLTNCKTNEGIFNHNITDIPDSILYNQLQLVEINKEFKAIFVYSTSYNNCPTDKNNNKNPSYNGNKNCTDLFKYNEFKIKIEKKGYSELVLFEKDPQELLPDYISLFVYPIAELSKESLIGTKKKYYKILSYPVLIAINKDESLDNLKSLIFKKFKKAIMNQFQSFENSIELFYPHLDASWEFLKINNGKCPLCSKTFNKAGFCCSLFEGINKSCSVKELIDKHKGGHLVLYAKSDIYDPSKYIYQGIELAFEKNNEIETKEVISLYDSFDSFNMTKTETDENWNCKHCKKAGLIKKTVNIYKLPIYLILKLKKGNNDKIFEYKKVFDFREYISDKNIQNTLYDLYAVILYKKSFNTSCYSCYCRFSNIWIEYNSDYIEPINSPISKDAYILFYKRRNVD